MFDQNRDHLRQAYADAWQKAKTNQAVTTLEQQLINVISEHPEYHKILENQAHSTAEFPPELGQSNPFLHMGLHLAIREQVATNRPSGIADLYQKLLQQYQSVNNTEHQIMEILAEILWQAQKHNQAPDEQAYLQGVRDLLKLT